MLRVGISCQMTKIAAILAAVVASGCTGKYKMVQVPSSAKLDVPTLLKSRDPGDRSRGIEMSRGHVNSENEGLLASIALYDAVPGLADRAAAALGAAHNEKLLVLFLKDSSKFQGKESLRKRRSVASCAVLINDRKSLEVLSALAADSDTETREIAYRGLARFRQADALHVLEKRMAKEHDTEASRVLSDSVKDWKQRFGG